MKYLTATVAALGLALAAAAPLHAQHVDNDVNADVNAANLVSVDISNVANEIAENLQISDVADIPVSVLVPVGIAANVCPNVAANVLAQAKKNDQEATCTADSVTQGLSKAVLKQMNKG